MDLVVAGSSPVTHPFAETRLRRDARAFALPYSEKWPDVIFAANKVLLAVTPAEERSEERESNAFGSGLRQSEPHAQFIITERASYMRMEPQVFLSTSCHLPTVRNGTGRTIKPHDRQAGKTPTPILSLQPRRMRTLKIPRIKRFSARISSWQG